MDGASFVAATVADWTAVASAAGAAIAAGAAWRSVALAERRLLPHLHVQPVRDLATGRIGVSLRNEGGGVGKAARLVMVIGNDGIIGLPGDGFLRPGEGYHFRTDISNFDDNAMVIAYCRDGNEVLHAWSSHGGRKVYRSLLARRKRYPELKAIFADFYPETTLDAVSWHEGRQRLIQPDEPVIPETAEQATQ